MQERLRQDNVIDNRETYLKDELLRILPKTENASIAVGYFFISGLAAVIRPMEDVNKIRLLISNTTDKDTAETLIASFHNIREVGVAIDETKFVNNDRKKSVITNSKDSTQQLLEHMGQTVDDKAVIESLMRMMASGQIEVRVYPKEKLHAKAYIFEPKDKDFTQGLGIVGSSNLSLAGISHNSELNLKTYNPADINQLLKWFDELWDEGLEFTDDFNLMLKKSWAGQTYSPMNLFFKAAYLEYRDKLEERHKLDPIWGTTFPPLFQFQKNAVDQSLTMFERYGGMILADVVGLGKTYIGTALLKYLQLQEYRPLIICPPALIGMWERFCVEYEVDAKILSRGQLSQDSFELYRDYRYKDRDVVLIDESHHFRNNNSRQYENMHQFMQARDAGAILLTATPYSNDPADIQNQLMLFHRSENTSIPPANATDLIKYFQKVKRGEEDLTDLLRNIMIRRTRRYVLNQWGKPDESGRKYLLVADQHKYFPKRKMKTNRYDIDKVYQKQYNIIVGFLRSEKGSKHLTLARYSPGLYLKEEYQKVELYQGLGRAGSKLVGLVRMLLLKRMESSLEAFKKSIQHLVRGHRIILKLLDEEIIPIGDVSYKAMYDIARDDPDSIYDPETIEEFKRKMQNAGETRYKFEAFETERLKHDIQNDIEIFETVSKMIQRFTWKTDDKLQRLQQLLHEDYAGKKVLIFTEFTDTAKYLDRNITWNGNKKQTDSSTRDSIQCARQFDPVNNPNPNNEKLTKSEEITLLISTDVLSEGVNLQAGEVIINYDFHWNPTRLIQRAGRVDRIGSNNEFITVHNFLPDLELEEDLRLEFLVDMKIKEIQRIIGEDHEILKDDEQINTQDIYAIYNEDESILDKVEDNQLEPSEFERILRDIQNNDHQIWEYIKSIPNGIRSSDGTESKGKLLIALESGTEQNNKLQKHYLVDTAGEILELNPQKALAILQSDDKKVYRLPKEYDSLVSKGLAKFTDTVEQIEARIADVRRGVAQQWVIAELMKMSSVKSLSNRQDEIEILRKAYSVPITKGKLNRELGKIKGSKMSYVELLDSLGQLYRHYDLQDRVQEDEQKSRYPRILYSKYVGNID